MKMIPLCFLDEVPPEILDYIFDYCTKKDLKNLVQCCKRFHKALIHKLYRNISISRSELSDGSLIEERQESLPFVQSLHCSKTYSHMFYFPDTITHNYQVLLKLCTDLKALSLEGTKKSFHIKAPGDHLQYVGEGVRIRIRPNDRNVDAVQRLENLLRRFRGEVDMDDNNDNENGGDSSDESNDDEDDGDESNEERNGDSDSNEENDEDNDVENDADSNDENNDDNGGDSNDENNNDDDNEDGDNSDVDIEGGNHGAVDPNEVMNEILDHIDQRLDGLDNIIAAYDNIDNEGNANDNIQEDNAGDNNEINDNENDVEIINDNNDTDNEENHVDDENRDEIDVENDSDVNQDDEIQNGDDEIQSEDDEEIEEEEIEDDANQDRDNDDENDDEENDDEENDDEENADEAMENNDPEDNDANIENENNNDEEEERIDENEDVETYESDKEEVIRDLTIPSGTDFVSDNIMIYKSLQICSHLVSLHFSYLENISRSSLDLLPFLSHLRELKITYSDVTTDILQCIGKCAQIEILIFENSARIDLPCCEIISRLTQLKKFILSKARKRPRISNQHLTNLKNLTTLELNSCIIRNDINDLFTSSIVLTELSLFDSEIYNDSLRRLDSQDQLTKLDLSYSFITNRSFEIIGRLKLLQILILSHNGCYKDAGIEYLRGLTNLKKLHLDHNGAITDRIFEVLRDLPIVDLNLCFNSKLFRGNDYVDLILMTKLKYLDISDINNVNDICLIFLSDMRLEQLIVSSRKITDSAISDFCKKTGLKTKGDSNRSCSHEKVTFTI